MNDNELKHYGIVGMKWGVRRYQNYDGTYTQAGMKRYNASMTDYLDKKNKYKDAKKSGAYTKGELTNKKLGVKKAKRQLEKDYKHLKLDKLGDKGKIRYANGETITRNNQLASTIFSATGTIAAGSQYLKMQGILDAKTADALSAASVIASGLATVKLYVIDEAHNKQLRAYYSHTSKY